jgi:hypothetical protein
MNPEMPSPQFTPERTPVDHAQSAEYGSAETGAEKAGEQSKEREQNMQAVDRASAMPAPPPILPLPSQQAKVVHMPAPPKIANDNPTVAADDDLIEKEWVDKAKKVVAESRDDPYKLEREVSKLQADYLRKRYGREIGVST